MGSIFYIAVAFTVVVMIVLLFAPLILRPSRAARRILEMVQSTRPDVRNIGRKERAQQAVLDAARWLQAKFGLAKDAKMKQLLLSGGIRSTRGMNLYFASRDAGPLFGLICGSLIHSNTVFWALS